MVAAGGSATRFVLCASGAIFSWGGLYANAQIPNQSESIPVWTPTHVGTTPILANIKPVFTNVTMQPFPAYTPDGNPASPTYVAPSRFRISGQVADLDGSVTQLKLYYSTRSGLTSQLISPPGAFDVVTPPLWDAQTIWLRANDNVDGTTRIEGFLNIGPDTLTVSANPAMTTEGDLQAPGVYTLHRSKGAGSLAAYLNFSGTATAGSDYDAPPAFVTFPEGSTDITVPIFALGDLVAESDETAVLSLQPHGTDYTIGAPSSAAVTFKNRNDLPHVEITTPTPGSTVVILPGQSIPVGANASDAEGTIQRLEFFVDNVSIGILNNQNSGIVNWTPTAGGTHAIKVIATDNSNDSVSSAMVSVTVNFATASIAISKPVQNQAFVAPVGIALNSALVDPSGSIDRIDYFAKPQGGTAQKIGTATGLATASLTWICTTGGTYELTAKAYDPNGLLQAESLGVTISVSQNLPPSVSLTSPASGSNVQRDDAVLLSATASDPEGEMVTVDFYVNGKLLGTSFDQHSPYTLTWVPDHAGTYQVFAKAYDLHSNSSQSTPVTVTVTQTSNGTVSITNPTDGQSFPLGSALVKQVSFTITAQDPEGVSAISLFVDGELNSQVTGASSAVIDALLGEGSHEIYARIYDPNGSESVSPVIQVQIVGIHPTVLQLAQEVCGTGVTIVSGSLSLAGTTAATLLFTGGGSQNIGLTSGALFTTGIPEVWNNTNTSPSTELELHQPGDRDLTQLTGAPTADAFALEFDFVPTGDTVEIEYVFGSEEYPEFVENLYNDAIAIYIDGVNIALVPGTADGVSVGSINEEMNSQYFVDNDAPATRQTIYDGFTVPLKAKAGVVPNTVHHVKIVIADARDEKYDAALFIKHGSFKSY